MTVAGQTIHCYFGFCKLVKTPIMTQPTNVQSNTKWVNDIKFICSRWTQIKTRLVKPEIQLYRCAKVLYPDWEAIQLCRCARLSNILQKQNVQTKTGVRQYYCFLLLCKADQLQKPMEITCRCTLSSCRNIYDSVVLTPHTHTQGHTVHLFLPAKGWQSNRTPTEKGRLAQTSDFYTGYRILWFRF